MYKFLESLLWVQCYNGMYDYQRVWNLLLWYWFSDHSIKVLWIYPMLAPCTNPSCVYEALYLQNIYNDIYVTYLKWLFVYLDTDQLLSIKDINNTNNHCISEPEILFLTYLTNSAVYCFLFLSLSNYFLIAPSTSIFLETKYAVHVLKLRDKR